MKRFIIASHCLNGNPPLQLGASMAHANTYKSHCLNGNPPLQQHPFFRFPNQALAARFGGPHDLLGKTATFSCRNGSRLHLTH